jgi:hypothetical protein
MRPATRAEASGYTETSRHADVMSFLAALDDPRLEKTSFGASPEGRELPLLVLGNAPDRPTVLVLCGIHAGEVEGKEAGLMLVGDLLDGAHEGILERLNLLVVPLFNPDGNDRIDPAHRALDLGKLEGQIGPAGGVGTRVNAAGINLNRDYLRKDALESRLLHAMWLGRAPHLTIDCHSTNGSVHRFSMTYDTPHTVESGRPEPVRFMREAFLPEVTRRVRAASGRESFFYGNFVDDEGGRGPGWMTYTHHPRFGSNYRGLTGRMDVLLECYSYLPFEERVATTYEFLVHSLTLAAERGDEIVDTVERSRAPRDRIAVRYRLEAEAAPATILTRSPRTLEGEPIAVTVPHLARFVGAEVVTRPWAYAVPDPIGQRLAPHGLAARVLDAKREARVEVARVAASAETGSRRILEAAGERLLTVEIRAETRALPPGTWIVETEQPLGAVATYLLEAASDDGLLACGFIAEPAAGDEWPALRVLEPTS